MPYTKKQIYSVLPASTVDNLNFSGRDAWCTNMANVMQQAGWTKRVAKAYTVITTTAGPAVSATVFMNCGTNNEGNWAIFNDITMKKIFIIDVYDAVPPSQMECILPGVVKAGYTSLGYLETGSLDGDAVHAKVLIGIQMLFPGSTVEEVLGPRQVIMAVNTNENFRFGLSFGTATITSGEPFRGGGWVLRCEPNRKIINNGIYGDDNYLEIYMTGTRPEVAPSSWGTQGLSVAGAKEFSTFPYRNPIAPATGVYANNLTSDGKAGKRYRSDFVNPAYGLPTTVFANPHQVIANSEAIVAADRFYIFGAALPLFDCRTSDGQALPITELTFYGAGGANSNGFFSSGYLSGSERKAMNGGVGFNNVRYDLDSGVGLVQGATQLLYLSSGRSSGAFNKGIPWVENYAPAMEPWIGWSWTGRSASDVAIYASHLVDAMILYENTVYPGGAANGSAAALPKFFQDGAWWKRYTKKALQAESWKAITLCLKVDEQI